MTGTMSSGDMIERMNWMECGDLRWAYRTENGTYIVKRTLAGYESSLVSSVGQVSIGGYSGSPDSAMVKCAHHCENYNIRDLQERSDR